MPIAPLAALCAVDSSGEAKIFWYGDARLELDLPLGLRLFGGSSDTGMSVPSRIARTYLNRSDMALKREHKLPPAAERFG